MKAALRGTSNILLFLVILFLAACSHSSAKPSNSSSWDPRAAAAYLDQREDWWMGWPTAARDHQTFCVSCHTAVPYALSRPVLRQTLGETEFSTQERRLLDDVTKRVRLWKEVGPFYTDKGDGTYKTEESRATEAVLNALILASYDAHNGRLSDDTRLAFDNMWALQETVGDGKGAWPWLQFDLEPWEASDSQYYGAVLAAVAVGTAPENYRSTPTIKSNLAVLREYFDRRYAGPSALNRVALLWASSKLPGLVEPDRRTSIIAQILSKQQEDGGWSLPALAKRPSWSLDSLLDRWIRGDGTAQDRKSDGYATGMMVFALQQAGVPRENAQVQKGLSWLMRNQDKTEGLWHSSSPNKRRDPSSGIGHFMSDAATAYAVLALTEGQGKESGPRALR
jgi:squalene-hopene/tetraprenyl-beta-curcumene cyclase